MADAGPSPEDFGAFWKRYRTALESLGSDQLHSLHTVAQMAWIGGGRFAEAERDAERDRLTKEVAELRGVQAATDEASDQWKQKARDAAQEAELHRCELERVAGDYHVILHSSLGKDDRFWGCSRSPCKRLAEYLRGNRSWNCKARNAGTSGGNAGQDCDWPFCGCDPAADRVISAIQESNLVIVPADHQASLDRERQRADEAVDLLQKETLAHNEIASRERRRAEAAEQRAKEAEEKIVSCVEMAAHANSERISTERKLAAATQWCALGGIGEGAGQDLAARVQELHRTLGEQIKRADAAEKREAYLKNLIAQHDYCGDGEICGVCRYPKADSIHDFPLGEAQGQ